MAEPDKPYLRRRDVREWIEPLGISIKQVDKLVSAGVLKPVPIGGGGRGYFLKSAVRRLLIEPFEAAERELSAGVCNGEGKLKNAK